MERFVVGKDESGIKLVDFLKKKLPGFSARELKQRGLEKGFCRINDRTERFASALVGAGDVILFATEKMHQQANVHNLEILHHDKKYLIINKPAGFSSDSMELLTGVRQIDPRAILVHRLDKLTTGALIFARFQEDFDYLIEKFKQQQVRKEYLALVDGTVAKQSGKMQTLMKKQKEYQGQAIWGSDKEGLTAITEWELLKTGKLASLLKCSPKTGRTHQLRVHLSEMGHPILGDFQYGRTFKCPYRPERFLLHAWKIAFDGIEVVAPLPKDFIEGMKATVGEWS